MIESIGSKVVFRCVYTEYTDSIRTTALYASYEGVGIVLVERTNPYNTDRADVVTQELWMPTDAASVIRRGIYMHDNCCETQQAAQS